MKLKQLRKEQNKSQKSVAEDLNINHTTYSNYELGQRDIPTDILIKLSMFYGVSVDYILGLRDEEQTKK